MGGRNLSEEVSVARDLRDKTLTPLFLASPLTRLGGLLEHTGLHQSLAVRLVELDLSPSSSILPS
jgi:hypothetical protein